MNNWQKVAELLKEGGVVIIPSDSSYGIAAIAGNHRAVERLYQIKSRETGKPSLLIVGSIKQAQKLVEFTPLAEELIKKHWPGGLTLVLNAKKLDLPSQVYGTPDHTPAGSHLRGGVENSASSHLGGGQNERGGQNRTLAVRFPNKKELQDLALNIGPFILPSANLAGEKPPFEPEEVDKKLIDAVDYFLDEPTAGNPPSTLVDATSDKPCILRQGSITVGEKS